MFKTSDLVSRCSSVRTELPGTKLLSIIKSKWYTGLEIRQTLGSLNFNCELQNEFESKLESKLKLKLKWILKVRLKTEIKNWMEYWNQKLKRKIETEN